MHRSEHAPMRASRSASASASRSSSGNASGNASKKACNLTLSAETLEQARALGMNVSQTVDRLLGEEVRRRRWERWNEDNKDAVAAYNARIGKEGLPLARYRTFLKGR